MGVEGAGAGERGKGWKICEREGRDEIDCCVGVGESVDVNS